MYWSHLLQKIREKMEELEREAEDLMRAEDEARSILAEIRKQKREEREAKRKADLGINVIPCFPYITRVTKYITP